MSTIRVRFPPSPTGLFHIGNARTALFNYLFAKRSEGVFVLRIEDTDRERSEKKYETDIFEGLKWLGIQPDEGPEQGGTFGPYRQSERSEIYGKYLTGLLKNGKAFYCFHSEQELEEEGKRLLSEKRAPIHSCEYRDMDIGEAEALARSRKDHIIRFKTPAGRQIAFDDLIRGEVTFSSDLIGDFSIAKRLDEPLYHFAVVVDDYQMQISHVIRGEDHIANTPKHILLAEALGFSLPQYAHLPLILGQDRSKLSKRHGATSVGEYRAQGYLPEALLNFMALLGWNPGGDQEIFSKSELIRLFSLDSVQNSGAVFDFVKLDWMNGEYIRKLSQEALFEQAKAFLPSDYTLYPIPYTLRALALEQPRLKKLSETGERTDYFFTKPEYEKELLRWKDAGDIDMLAALERSHKIISRPGFQISKDAAEKEFFKEIGDGDKGMLLWPLRVALTGKKASSGPFEIMEILGIEETLERIRAAKNKWG